MFNRCVFIGRLTRDPELKYTQTGTAVTKFTLAVDRAFKNAQGEKEADFIDIITWRQLAEICSSNLDKGRLVAVEGRLQIRSYEDNQGNKRRAAEIIADNVRFLDSKRKDGNSGEESHHQGNGTFGGFGHEVSLDDDIPF